MSPFSIPSPEIDQHPRNIPITSPESPSASTVASSDSIGTVPSSLSSEIIGESISSRRSGLPVESTNIRTSQSIKPGPFTQHKRFFFEDGNITFLVDGILYRVHRYFLCRDSKLFKTRLLRLPAQESSSLVISIENLKSKDFDAFLSILYPLDFNASEEHSFEELSSILDLSTRWGFASIRELAIRRLNPPTPYQRLILARKCGVDQWIFPALQELCERPQQLTPDEAHLMELEDVVLVGSVREMVRKHTPTMKSTAIRDCIEARRNGEPWEQPLSAPEPWGPPGSVPGPRGLPCSVPAPPRSPDQSRAASVCPSTRGPTPQAETPPLGWGQGWGAATR